MKKSNLQFRASLGGDNLEELLFVNEASVIGINDSENLVDFNFFTSEAQPEPDLGEFPFVDFAIIIVERSESLLKVDRNRASCVLKKIKISLKSLKC